MEPEATVEPEAAPEPEATMEPEATVEPEAAPEPNMNPEPSSVLTGTPAVLILANRSSSMFQVYDLDTDTGCPTGGSLAYGSYPSRWDALRAIVASLADLSGDIAFSSLSFNGINGGVCPQVTGNANPVDFDALLASLPEAEAACPSPKGESPTGAAVDAAADTLVGTAPDSPKYILLITRGVPDSCAVPDPQCGGDPAIGAVQRAYSRGITTLVVSLHEDDDVTVSEYLAQAGRGLTVAPYPEDTTQQFCIEQEASARGVPYDLLDWRVGAEATYGPSGFKHSETLSYSGTDMAAIHDALEDIASGTF
jgi:hypothetical protein